MWMFAYFCLAVSLLDLAQLVKEQHSFGGLVAFLCRSLLGEGNQGLECQHVRSNHFWYSFMPLQSHLSKLASWEDCSSIFLFLLFFFCRDDSIWYSLILSYVWWDMIKLTCKKPVKSIPQLSNWLFIPLGWSLTKSHRWRRNQSSTSGDQCAAQIISNLFTSMLFVHRTRHIWSSHMVSSYRHGTRMYILYYIILWYTYGIPHLYI